ncbi:MAG: hypothetical protein JWL92_343 [Candidatus Nomurabacteria bacterium]|nr:hypothetical protein [Candidatus Nomurabacteria bacterium]
MLYTNTHLNNRIMKKQLRVGRGRTLIIIVDTMLCPTGSSVTCRDCKGRGLYEGVGTKDGAGAREPVRS